MTDSAAICPHFQPPEQHTSCAAGVNYLALTGGGAFNLVLRLPCLPLSNRRGQVAAVCTRVNEGQEGK